MKIGIVGGGQLGRMLTDAAHALGHTTIVLDPTPNSPAIQVADEHMVGDFKDPASIEKLAHVSDVMTFEIESANAVALHMLSERGFPIHPTPVTLSIIKDKLRQKAYLTERGIPVADFVEVTNEETAREAGTFLKYPFVLKARSGGYDGHGNATIRQSKEIPEALKALGTELYAERFVHFEKELAVVAARTVTGEIAVFPLVETIHKDHICHMTITPADVPAEIAQKAHDLAEKVMNAFEGAGVFGIEMFQVGSEVVVNEIAPRVHNSGHWTIEGSETSQFEQHVRAITGMPLGPVSMKSPAAVMINILGERNALAEPSGITEAEKIKGVKVHIYGKMETRLKRKMGHLTALGESVRDAIERAEQARSLISI